MQFSQIFISTVGIAMLVVLVVALARVVADNFWILDRMHSRNAHRRARIFRKRYEDYYEIQQTWLK